MDNTFTISKIVEIKDNPEYPLLATFQNGDLVQNSVSKRTCEVSVTSDDNKRQRVEISSSNGHTFSGLEEDRNDSRLFCIVRKDAEAEMIEIGSVSLLNNKFYELANAYAPEMVEARTSALTRSFAGKKQIRKMDQSAKMKLDSSTIETTLIDSVNAIEPKEESTPMSVQIEASMSDILPPCNRDATNVCDVYNLVKMFGEELVGNLVGKMTESLEMPIGGLNFTLSQFVRTLWENIKASKTNREEKAVAAILMQALQNFINTGARDLRRKARFSPNAAVNEKIMEIFTVTTPTGEICRSTRMKDKALCYIIALSFIAGDYSFQMSELSQFVNVSPKKMGDLCRSVGGTENKAIGRHVLKLPLPPLPTRLVSVSKKRKR